MAYRKADVDTHCNGTYHGPVPAVNVKVELITLQADRVAERAKCSLACAQQAIDWAFEFAQERFWEDVQEFAVECFGAGVKVWSSGRSGGWATVAGLEDLEDWDAIALTRWKRFRRMIRQEIAFLTSEEYLLNNIDANRWAEEQAEKYNYIDTADGKTVCLADVPRCLHCKEK